MQNLAILGISLKDKIIENILYFKELNIYSTINLSTKQEFIDYLSTLKEYNIKTFNIFMDDFKSQDVKLIDRKYLRTDGDESSDNDLVDLPFWYDVIFEIRDEIFPIKLNDE